MRVRHSRYLILALTIASAACRHSLTREEALTAIQQGEPLRGLLTPDSERVAHETVADCRAMYSDDPRLALMAGDSAWIILSSAGLLDLADVDAPADPRQKKHCRAVLTARADKAAFHEAPDSSKSPWTSYWTVETAHAKAELLDIPESSGKDSAVADFAITQERTPLGELLHRPLLSDSAARLFSTTLTGHFRWHDDGWRLESFEEKK